MSSLTGAIILPCGIPTTVLRRRPWAEMCIRDRLNAVQGKFSASAFVREHAGVDNVCERAAVADGGTLIVPKTARDGVTVAVSEMKWGMSFV